MAQRSLLSFFAKKGQEASSAETKEEKKEEKKEENASASASARSSRLKRPSPKLANSKADNARDSTPEARRKSSSSDNDESRSISSEEEYMPVKKRARTGKSQVVDVDDSPVQKAATKRSFASVKKIEDTVKSATKYTPLETQVVAIKAQYPDTVLFVEVGYKYKLYGDDAEIASSILNVYCFRDHNFLVASIPTHKINVHLPRIVNAGYKCGIVSQTETAALKSQSQGKGSTFQRAVTALFTPGTLIDGDLLSQQTHNETIASQKTANDNDPGMTFDGTQAGSPSYLVCLHETEVADDSTGHHVSFVALHLATAEVVWDLFVDDSAFSELTTRLLHCPPSEVLYSSSVSTVLKKYVSVMLLDRHVRFQELLPMAGSSGRDLPELVRKFDFAGLQSNGAESGKQAVNRFFQLHELSPSEQHLAQFFSLPPAVIACVSVLMFYLRDFRLDKVFLLEECLHRFHESDGVTHRSSVSRTMRLSGITIANLELLANSTDRTVRGSLLWVLDHTRTPGGSRLLQKWIVTPLLDGDEIRRRQDSVEALTGSVKFDGGVNALEVFEPLICLLSNRRSMSVESVVLPDLEQALARMQYGKSRPSEFVRFLQGMQALCGAASAVTARIERSSLSAVVPEQLIRLAKSFPPSLFENCARFLRRLDVAAASQNRIVDIYLVPDEVPAVTTCKSSIANILAELDSYLKGEVRTLLKNPSQEFSTNNGIEFQLEVPRSRSKLVPADWTQVSSTKLVVRYHTARIRTCVDRLTVEREKLVMAARTSWAELVQKFVSRHFSECSSAARAFAEFDVLMSLAVCARQAGWIRPIIYNSAEEESDRVLSIVGGRNPIVEKIIDQSYVPNDLELRATSADSAERGRQRALVITGPNMGGKSSFVRQIALCVCLSQMGSFIPATSATLSVCDAVFTRMGSEDAIQSGQSTFFVELQQTSVILRNATKNSLVILDELGRGTSTVDGCAIADATLRYLLTEVGCFTLFVTHFASMSRVCSSLPHLVRDAHMSFITDSDEVSDSASSTKDGGQVSRITFLYTVVDGPAMKSYGLNVAALAGLQPHVLAVAREKSVVLETGFSENTRLTRLTDVLARTRLMYQRGIADSDLQHLSQAARAVLDD